MTHKTVVGALFRCLRPGNTFFLHLQLLTYDDYDVIIGWTRKDTSLRRKKERRSDAAARGREADGDRRQKSSSQPLSKDASEDPKSGSSGG